MVRRFILAFFLAFALTSCSQGNFEVEKGKRPVVNRTGDAYND
ncbi:MAG: hypothetical protein ACHP6I_00025 [Rickettsiales bacterium]